MTEKPINGGLGMSVSIRFHRGQIAFINGNQFFSQGIKGVCPWEPIFFTGDG